MPGSETCDHQGGVGGVKGIGKVCQLMERCDGHVRGVKGCGEMLHLSVC